MSETAKPESEDSRREHEFEWTTRRILELRRIVTDRDNDGLQQARETLARIRVSMEALGERSLKIDDGKTLYINTVAFYEQDYDSERWDRVSDEFEALTLDGRVLEDVGDHPSGILMDTSIGEYPEPEYRHTVARFRAFATAVIPIAKAAEKAWNHRTAQMLAQERHTAAQHGPEGSVLT